MTIPKGFQSSAGKQNLLASFNNWLIENVEGGHVGIAPLPSDKEFFWDFDFPIEPQDFPAIATTEIGLFNLGEIALDRFLGFDENGNECFGTRNQTLVEITAFAKDSATFTGATNTVRNLRDRIVQALTVEPIPLRNYNVSGNPEIGIIEVDRQSNAINEKFIVDPSNQNVKRYVVIVRIFWLEVTGSIGTRTLTSDAEIT